MELAQRNPPFPPAIALVAGILAISTGSIFVRWAQAPALVIAAYRVGIASLFFLPFVCWNGRHELSYLKSRDYLLTLVSGFFLALHFATWISSLDYTSVASSIVMVNTTPLWVALLTPFLTGDHIDRSAILGMAISFTGGIFVGLEDWGTGERALRGDLLALAGGACLALYLIAGRNVRHRISNTTYIALCYTSAALFLWFTVWIEGMPVVGFSSKTWWALIAMALIPQIIGHGSYNWALGWFSASLVSMTLLGESVIASLLAFLLLDETLSMQKILGGILILSGIYLVSRNEMGAVRLSKKTV